MRPTSFLTRALVIGVTAFGVHAAESRESARFEFPTTGVSADGGALLLAIDDVLLPLRYNLCYYLSQPADRTEPVVKPGRENPAAPDFLAAHFYGTVLEERGKFRMWYYPISAGDKPSALKEGPICYAESQDGIRWVKPNLGQVDIRGSRANNAIQLPGARINGGEVIRDDDEPDPSRRYKMMYNCHNGRTWTMRTATSADGIHWTAQPHFVMDAFGVQGCLLRHNGFYLVYGQSHPFGEGGAIRGRQGYAWVSPDFDRWLLALAEAFALPEPANPADRGASKPYDQVHLGVGATSFGSVVVGLYGIWHERGPNSSGASCDLGLVVSNDGIHFREPVKGFVYMSSEKSRATPVPGKSYPTNLCAGNGILNVGDETRIYYGRWRNAPVGDDYYGEVALARLPRDRWGAVGLAPRATEGEIWSAPLRIPTGGCRVALNAEGARGMSVELADDRFRPLEGFSGAASATPKTDSGLDCPVRWSRGLESLAGQTVRLHIRVGKQGGVEPRLYAVYLRSGK